MTKATRIFSSSSPIRLGIIGGGQLGKMIAQEAVKMSISVIILDPTPNCPASQVCKEQIIADFKEENAIKELSTKSDIITYEIELANSEALKTLQSSNYPIHPSPDTLRTIQNKYRQKVFLKKNNIPVVDFKLIKSKSDLFSLLDYYGFPLMLKASVDSYDGRGNYLIKSEEQISLGFKCFENREIFVEKFIDFKKEISVMVARNHDGKIESFPVVENIHVNNILSKTIAPADISKITESKAKIIAEKTMNSLKGSGIFGIEMFVTKNDDVLVNEIAPRPHNSGHYTIESCSISQFEQHIRAVFNLPLMKPELLRPAVMINILGPENATGTYEVRGIESMFSIPGVKFHLYGKKTSSPRRKLGHITATGKTIAEANSRAEQAINSIEIIINQNKKNI
ncbi:MAG: 5-(carboxyamino)imidazole ribonucleotide synthase [Nitrososphaeraceae archaeon]|nr:5-(carboxyamino)imidazole ribonucleotide synthase [Nitrososphaeraceae archaeon]